MTQDGLVRYTTMYPLSSSYSCTIIESFGNCVIIDKTTKAVGILPVPNTGKQPFMVHQFFRGLCFRPLRKFCCIFYFTVHFIDLLKTVKDFLLFFFFLFVCPFFFFQKPNSGLFILMSVKCFDSHARLVKIVSLPVLPTGSIFHSRLRAVRLISPDAMLSA